jgi:hypothetical protein
MLKTENPNERIIALDHTGTFHTKNGIIKVLVVTIKEIDPDMPKESDYK